MRGMLFAIGCGLLLGGCDAPNGTTAPNETAAPDNTAVNERDADGHSVTPMDQSNAQADIDQVAQIRSRVLEIKDLSVSGRNVKIVTDGGKVVLRGPVASAAERTAIVDVANKVAGSSNVSDHLEVAP